jgi:hypothetical protein
MLACVLGAGFVRAQGPDGGTAQKPLMADDVFKNIQVLRGVPVREFMQTMGFFAASLSLNCVDCHVSDSAGSWPKYADDTPLKQTARKMVIMVRVLNQGSFAGARKVTCYTCHRGSPRPETIPSLDQQYASPGAPDADTVQIMENGRKTPTADQILDRFITVLGGAEKLAKVKSYVAKGTYAGFDTDFQDVPVQILAKSPDQHSTVVDLRTDGHEIMTFDGMNAWIAGPVSHTPVPVIPLSGSELEGAKVEGLLSFPEQLKQSLTDWKVGFPEAEIADKDVQVVEGTSGTTPIKFYFSKTTGLLVRVTRFTDTIIGTVPTRIEFADYRLIPALGIKMPYKITNTWTDGQSKITLTQIQPNAAVDPAKFDKPAPPVGEEAAPKK